MGSGLESFARVLTHEQSRQGVAMSDSSPALPLAGIRVLDATSNIAGPFGGAILADLGADVLKIEMPVGDPSRSMSPVDGDRSAYFHIVNRNKDVELLDLKSSDGKTRLHELLASADVFLTNFLPDRLAALEISSELLLRKFPRVIFGNLSSYGSTGPDAAAPGYDATVQARTGIMHVTGEPDGAPVRAGVSVLDVGGGMWLAIGILAALVERHNTGKGKVVETSLYETGATWVSYHLSAEQITTAPSVRSGSGHPAFAPYGIFATSHGTLCIGVGNNNIFAKLCTMIGREDLITNPAFAVNVDRVKNSKELNAEIEKALATHDAQYWAELLGRNGVPADRVALPEELHHDAQGKAIDLLLDYPDASTKVKKIPGVPLRFNGKRPPIRKAAPHRE
jgi:crotonobetainyl-CoA:carnitine CoA-transferase CaiB-like acyl-CoA transferase